MELASTIGLLRHVARRAIDAVMPPQCIGCSALVDAPGALCADCFNGFTFITAPLCRVCGLPLQAVGADELVCGSCLRERPEFNRARAVFVYDTASKGVVLKFKHGDRTDAAAHLARWMLRAGEDLITDCDVIVPVPLHRWRLLWRSYNHAALLANALGRLARKPVVADALRRVRATPSQGQLDRKARRRNVARAFAGHRTRALAEKKVLLIDDVLTTGAPADGCARALLAAGARRVDVLVLGRVPGPAG